MIDTQVISKILKIFNANQIDELVDETVAMLKEYNRKYSLLEGTLALDMGAIRKLARSLSIKFNDDLARLESGHLDRIKNVKNAIIVIVFKLFSRFASQLLTKYDLFLMNLPDKSNQINDLRGLIHILAGLLFCCTNKKHVQGKLEILDYRYVLNIESPGLKKQLVSPIEDGVQLNNNDILVNAINYLLTVDDDKLDPLMNSVVVIKAYIACCLSNLDELIQLYKCLYAELDSNDIESIETPTNHFLRQFLSLTNVDLSIPYKEEGRLEYTIMPFYLGENRFTSENEYFSTCVESSLFHLCNFLLWDADQNKYIKVVGVDPQSAPVHKIFNDVLKRNSHTREDLYLWHTFIQNLSPNLRVDEPIENQTETQMKNNPFDYYFYVKEYDSCRNELKSGLITFMKFLEHLTGKQGQFTDSLRTLLTNQNWTIDEKFEWNQLAACLKEAFVNICGEEYRSKLDVKFFDGRYEVIGNKYEIFGRFKVSRKFDLCVVQLVIMEIDITERCHTQPYLDKLKIRSNQNIHQIKNSNQTELDDSWEPWDILDYLRFKKSQWKTPKSEMFYFLNLYM